MSDDQKEQVFTIRIKLLEKVKGKWQGYVIAPPDDKKKHYFSDLFKLDAYIVARLIKMRVQVGWFWQMMSRYKFNKDPSRSMQEENSELIPNDNHERRT